MISLRGPSAQRPNVIAHRCSYKPLCASLRVLFPQLTPMAEPLCFRQPFRGLYILQRALSTLVLILYWTIKYYRTSARPRQTWTLCETVCVMVLRRMMRINEATGIMLECTDKTRGVDDRSLRETSFVWLPPVEDTLVQGTAKSEDVRPIRIPGYVWPQGTNLAESQGYVGYWASCLQRPPPASRELTNEIDPRRCI